MSFLGKLAKNLFSPLLMLTGLLGGSKKAPTPLLPPPTLDQAQQEADQNDALARRRGAAADMLTGTRGAEATAGSVGRVVAGN